MGSQVASQFLSEEKRRDTTSLRDSASQPARSSEREPIVLISLRAFLDLRHDVVHHPIHVCEPNHGLPWRVCSLENELTCTHKYLSGDLSLDVINNHVWFYYMCLFTFDFTIRAYLLFFRRDHATVISACNSFSQEFWWLFVNSFPPKRSCFED